MPDSFKDKFEKVGAGWRNKKGSGWNCKLEKPLPADTYFLIFEKTEKKNPKQPDVELFIEKAKLAEPQPPSEQDEAPF